MGLPLSSSKAQNIQKRRRSGLGPGKVLAENSKVVVLSMSVDDWINVKNHPRQRDTQCHARASHWREARLAEGALKNYLAHVVGAILDGELYKVDGHTRAYLWQKEELERPNEVIVTAYKVKSYEELLDLYRAVDVPSASETWTDRVFGAFHEHGYAVKTASLKTRSLANALHIALRGVPISQRESSLRAFDVYKAVRVFLPEIVRIDQFSPSPDIARIPGIIAAALIMFTLHSDEVQEFFHRLFAKKGEKRQGKSDPVEAVLDLINEYKSFVKYRKPPLIQVDICGRCIRAANYFMDGMEKAEMYWLKNKLHYIDIAPFVKLVREKKVSQEEEAFL